ncbi:MAG: ribbon-helix-helix protein, CopG family [Bryobacteraceae bacterium]
MRTTLTLDDEVAARLKQEVRRSGRSFKETVNELLREGLASRKTVRAAAPPLVKARDLRLRPGFNLDNVEELLDQLEGSVRR